MSKNSGTVYTIVTKDKKGTILEERETKRNSFAAAHAFARFLFSTADLPVGTTMTLSLGTKVLEKFSMLADGWDWERIAEPKVSDVKVSNTKVPHKGTTNKAKATSKTMAKVA